MAKILCIGEEWTGSNASGLFNALSRAGHVITIINELRYISLSASSKLVKGLNRLIRKQQVFDFNRHCHTSVRSFRPDLILVYKGAFMMPETIHQWKKEGIPVVIFFPDVSFLAHGNYIPKCIPYYDFIFTTKSFGSKDLASLFKYPKENVHFMLHGYDPLVHKKYTITTGDTMINDASFIGNYSHHKADYLAYLKNNIENFDLKIWGSTWHQNSYAVLSGSIQHVTVIGNAYAYAINASKINIALLSEVVAGASSGDQITSRTFHIPGSGGFMIHQRTDELLTYFSEDRDVVCFSSKEELRDKITYYLNHENERNNIAQEGYKNVQKNHSLDVRANEVIQVLTRKGILNETH